MISPAIHVVISPPERDIRPCPTVSFPRFDPGGAQRRWVELRRQLRGAHQREP